MLRSWIKVFRIPNVQPAHWVEPIRPDHRLHLHSPRKTPVEGTCSHLCSSLCFSFLSFPYFLRLASSVWGYIPNRLVLLVSESISVPRRGPVGAPRKLELRTRNEMNAAIFMRVWERNPWWGSAEIRMEWHWIHGRGTRGKRALHHTGERLIAGRWSVRRGASRSAEWQWRARHALGGSCSWKPFDFCSHPRHGSVFYSGSSVNGGRPSYTVFPPFCFMREN